MKEKRHLNNLYSNFDRDNYAEFPMRLDTFV